MKRVKDTWEKLKNKITELWHKNRKEIIDSIVHTKQSDRRKKTELEEQFKRECQAERFILVVGVAYILIGVVLIAYLKISHKFSDSLQAVVVSCELIVLGIYALLHVFIFYCVKGRWRETKIVNNIKEILIFLMLPYHLCMKGINALIRISKQEHVIHILPFYMISLLFVMFTFILILRIGSRFHLFEACYAEATGLIIVVLLIFEFFRLGKLIAYLITKLIIKSVQKVEVKQTSKTNWRAVLNNDDHKAARRNKVKKEWKIIEKELECTKIYFYIFLTIFVLLIPKQEGTVTALLANQFLGIITITALGREVRAKYDDIEESHGGQEAS